MLGVPILRDGSVLGVVTVYRMVPGLFSGAQVKLLETFAAQAAIALDNARLFNETREALEQQTAISDILRITTESPTDAQPVLDTIADQAVRLCDATSASLFLLEGDGLRHVSTCGALAWGHAASWVCRCCVTARLSAALVWRALSPVALRQR